MKLSKTIKNAKLKVFASLGLTLLLTAGVFLYFKLAESPSTQTAVVDHLRVAMSDCFEANQKDCYVNLAKEALDKYSYEKILQAFIEIETEPQILTRCHPVMHFLGRLQYQRTGDITDTLTRSSPTCISGSYHGAVEGYFINEGIPFNDPDDSLYTKIINQICGENSDYPKQEIYNQCNHGIGHAMMFVTEADLPRSLRLCDALATQLDRQLCYTGVFMENSNSSTDPNHPSKYVRADEPLYPCNLLEERHQSPCYSLKAAYFFKLTDGDWDKTMELCGLIPTPYRSQCFYTMGAHQVGYITEPEDLTHNCLRTAEEFKNSCIQGVTSHLIIRYGGDPQTSYEFCPTLPIENKHACYEELGRSQKNWTTSDAELSEVCNKIKETDYVSTCLSFP